MWHDALIGLLVSAAAGLTGWGILAAIDRHSALDFTERLIFSLPVGITASGALLYTANVSGALFALPLVVLVLAAGCALGLFSLWKPRRELAPPEGPAPFRITGIGVLCAVVALAIAAAYTAMNLLSVNHGSDTALYHFPYAAYVMRTGRQPVYATPAELSEYSFPPALFVFYAVEWVCQGHVEQLLPNLLCIPLFCSLVGITWLAVRRVSGLSPTAAVFALLLIVDSPALTLILGGENTDLLPFVLQVGAAYLGAQDLNERCHRRLWPACMLMGLSGWVRLDAVPCAFCLAAALACVGRCSRETVRSAGWMLISPFLLLIPYLVRNAVIWGSPVYPLAGSWLGGYLINSSTIRLQAAHWQATVWQLGDYPQLILRMLTAPAVVFGLAGAWLARSVGPALRMLAAAGAGFLLVCLFLLSNETVLRFAWFGMALFSWIGAGVLDRLESQDRAAVRTLAMAALVCAAGALIDVALYHPVFPAASLEGAWWMRPHDIHAAGTEFAWLIALSGWMTVAWLRPGKTVRRWTPAVCAFVAAVVGIQNHHPYYVLTRTDWKFNQYGLGWRYPAARYPVEAWMQRNLGSEDVVYALSISRWATPAALVALDDPLLTTIHSGPVSLRTALEAVRRMGVEYVLIDPGTDLDPAQNYQIPLEDPILAHLHDTRFFRLVVVDSHLALYRIRYPGNAGACRPTPGRPMPWLMDYAAGCPPVTSEDLRQRHMLR